jgi:hypothetical protein
MYNGALFSHKEWNHVIWRKMGTTRDHHVKQNKPDSERWASEVFIHMCNHF